MKFNQKILILIIVLSILLIFQSAFTEVRLPRLINDGMVLQRDANVKIWGWGAVGEAISIDFMDKTYSTSADEDSKWAIILALLKAGGAYNLEIHGSIQIILKDIMISDVWICSGQSNVVLTMDRIRDRHVDEIVQSDNPAIRQFLVTMKFNFNIVNKG